jgi:hypothetical protein
VRAERPAAYFRYLRQTIHCRDQSDHTGAFGGSETIRPGLDHDRRDPNPDETGQKSRRRSESPPIEWEGLHLHQGLGPAGLAGAPTPSHIRRSQNRLRFYEPLGQ